MDYGKNQHATLPVVSVIYNTAGILYNLNTYISKKPYELYATFTFGSTKLYCLLDKPLNKIKHKILCMRIL